MPRHLLPALALALAAVMAPLVQAQSPADPRAADRQEETVGRYAPVNGLDLYYEVHGEGKPLLLLHGGIAAFEIFESGLPVFTPNRQVILVHLQGHGHTRDIDRPLSYEAMADDIAALLDHLAIPKADIMGYSLGGGVATQFAIRHPGMVDRLVVVSSGWKRDGYFPEVLEQFDRMEAMAPQIGANVARSPLAAAYPEVDWVALFAKTGRLLAQDYDWSAKVAEIDAPTMLVFADADALKPGYMAEAWQLIGGGKRDAGLDGASRPLHRFAIVPGATHYDLVRSPTVARLVEAFLSQTSSPPDSGER